MLSVAAASGPIRALAAEGGAFGVEAGPIVTIPPTIGFRSAGEAARFTLALPWSVQFGPLLQGEAGAGLRPYRAVLEPGLLLPSGGTYTSFYLRGGLRRIANAVGIFGLGLGLGYTQSMSRNLSSAISQEVIFTVGPCCSPGTLLVSVRYEYLLSGSGEVWTSVGFPLW